MTQTRRGFFSSLVGLASAPLAVAKPVGARAGTWTRRYVLDKRLTLPVLLTVKDEDWPAIAKGAHPRYKSLDHMTGQLSALRVPEGDASGLRRFERRRLRKKFQALK